MEAALLSSDYIDNVMVYVDPFHSYCVALVVPSHQMLEKWAHDGGIKYEDFAELCDKPEAVAEVHKSLSQVPLSSFFSVNLLTFLIHYSK